MSDAANRLGEVRAGIAAAAKAARRDPGSIRLIAVSKGRSAAEIEPLLAAGQSDFGESRVQEAQAKWPELRARHPGTRLHFIGRLQSNKADDAIQLFDVIHSLDRPALVAALAEAAVRHGRSPQVYVQVNLGEEAQKGGCAPSEVANLVAAVRDSKLNFAGLMGIPPLGPEPAPYFALLAKLARSVGTTGLSMGMSADYRTGVMLGATAVRVGSALFADP